MSDEEINKLKSSTILAPTSFNIQNGRFLVVRDMLVPMIGFDPEAFAKIVNLPED